MKMTVVTGSEVSKYLKRKVRSVYDDVYEAIDNLEKGKALVVEYEDEKRALMLASSISYKVIRDNKNKSGRFYGCYYTKSGCNVIIGKN